MSLLGGDLVEHRLRASVAVHRKAQLLDRLLEGDVRQIGSNVAAYAVLIGFATNTLSKTVVAFGTGGRSFALHLLPGLLAMLAAFAAVLLTR